MPHFNIVSKLILRFDLIILPSIVYLPLVIHGAMSVSILCGSEQMALPLLSLALCVWLSGLWSGWCRQWEV